jgi:hypothetical protein
MKANHILSFTLYTLNIVCGKPGRGGALASWLVEPLVANLVPTDCTSYSVAYSAIRAPTCTLCVLHQSTWFSTQPLTLAKQVGCMCIVPRIVPNGD